MNALARLASALRAEGGLLSGALTGETDGDQRLGDLASQGPRTAGREDEYALLFESIREGALLHYGEGRVVAPEDPDLALLEGDRLYAEGLAALAAAGDMPAVRIMAEGIAGAAAAKGAGDETGAEAAWEQGLRAMADGDAATGNAQ